MKQYSAEVQKGLKRARFVLSLDFDPRKVEHQPEQVGWQKRLVSILAFILLVSFVWFFYFIMISSLSFRDQLEGFPFLQKAWYVLKLIFSIGFLYYLTKSSIFSPFKKRPNRLKAWSPPTRKQVLSTFDLTMDRFTVDVLENEHPHWRLHCQQFVKLLRTPLKLKTEADVYMDDNGHPRCVIVDSDEHKLVFVVHQMEDLSESPKTKEPEQE